jgi:hypothetical protein
MSASLKTMVRNKKEGNVPRKLSRMIREAVQDELVDQTMVDAMVAAVARNDHVSSLPWWSRSCYRLGTPYGDLRVSQYFKDCWHAWRDSVPLVHANTGKHAVFTAAADAKTFALVHVADGWTGEVHTDDGLCWKSRR